MGKSTAGVLRAEADKLAEIQTAERGTVPWEFQDKKIKVVGPYIPTPEREARAARIVALRKQAARLESE